MAASPLLSQVDDASGIGGILVNRGTLRIQSAVDPFIVSAALLSDGSVVLDDSRMAVSMPAFPSVIQPTCLLRSGPVTLRGLSSFFFNSSCIVTTTVSAESGKEFASFFSSLPSLINLRAVLQVCQ